MTEQQQQQKHPITPPPELVCEWLGEFFGCAVSEGLSGSDHFLATRAALAQPEQQAPTDEELDLVVIAIQALTPHQPDVTTHDLYAIDRGREILKERLACWGCPTSDELEQFNA